MWLSSKKQPLYLLYYIKPKCLNLINFISTFTFIQQLEKIIYDLVVALKLMCSECVTSDSLIFCSTCTAIACQDKPPQMPQHILRQDVSGTKRTGCLLCLRKAMLKLFVYYSGIHWCIESPFIHYIFIIHYISIHPEYVKDHINGCPYAV